MTEMLQVPGSDTNKVQSWSGHHHKRCYSLGGQDLFTSRQPSKYSSRDLHGSDKQRDRKTGRLPTTPRKWRQKSNSISGSDFLSFRNRHSTLKVNKGTSLAKFKTLGKLTIWCARLAKEYYTSDSMLEAISPYVSGIKFNDYDTSSKEAPLVFDPSMFKADKQLRIPAEVARIMSNPKHLRTDKECRQALVALRNIKAIAEYPVRMQRNIVAVGQYEKYGARRVIVHQNQPASSFYFILSGSVVIMVRDEGSRMSRPVAYLSKGMAFGELAIINRTTRQSTVIAKETIELLSIFITDFHDIFMSGGVKNINDPDHNDFLNGGENSPMYIKPIHVLPHAFRNLPCMRGWPIRILADNQDKCIFHYFKRGDILVQDSNFSSWIYMVKSGSIQVLKKLHQVTPQINRRAQESQIKRTGENHRAEWRLKQLQYSLSDIKIPTCVHEEDDEVFEHPRSSGGERYDFAQKSHMKQERVEPSFTLPQLKPFSTARGHSPNIQGFFNGSVMPVVDCWSRCTSKNNHRKPKSKTERISFEDASDDFSREMSGRKQEIRTITQDLDAAFKLKTNNNGAQREDKRMQLVHIQTLTKGQTFGVVHTILGGQPSFCLVSNGAECIMLDKTFYMQHAPDELIQKLRHECSPYPSDQTMQEALQMKTDWQAFKNTTLKDLRRHLQDIKCIRKP